jgi:hypothetical protein
MLTSAPSTPSPARTRAGSINWPTALTVDVLLVLLFAGIGRHAHALDPAGVLETAWPFLAGLLLGWATWQVHRAPFAPWPRGIALWLSTVAVGLGLRVLVGEGTAPSFMLVTLVVLAVLLLGPRCLALLVRTSRSRRRTG